jgi:hypothetical protein
MADAAEERARDAAWTEFRASSYEPVTDADAKAWRIAWAASKARDEFKQQQDDERHR